MGEHEEPQVDAPEVIELHVMRALWHLRTSRSTDASPAELADGLVRSVHPLPGDLVAEVVGDHLVRAAARLRHGGWSAADVEELVVRNLGREHLAVAVAAGQSQVRLRDHVALGSGLMLTALFARAPVVQGVHLAAPAATSVSEHPRLARVRALLAKAESTEFDEEAEALSAKAQELITRYALEGLVDAAHGAIRGDPIVLRRIWLDPPYVRAKGSLVHAVAQANRCRAALCEPLSFSDVVGAPRDLEAVELLATSLLVQASTAMLRQARVAGSDAGRTRSFRRAFLLAYAARIGDRLQRANDAVTGEDATRLPVLRDHGERVTAAFDAMVPHTVARATSISNHAGWVAGTAAADLANLHVRSGIEESA